MRTLILWRHAKSSWDNPDLNDFDRPLNARGQRAAPTMAGWISEHWPPDAVVCSPARRTVQTWNHLERRLNGAVPVAFDRRIYEAPCQTLLTVVRESPPTADTAMLIGHNPGLEDLTAALAAPLGRKFSTGAVAVLRFEGRWSDLREGDASIAAFQRPKALHPVVG